MWRCYRGKNITFPRIEKAEATREPFSHRVDKRRSQTPSAMSVLPESLRIGASSILANRPAFSRPFKRRSSALITPNSGVRLGGCLDANVPLWYRHEMPEPTKTSRFDSVVCGSGTPCFEDAVARSYSLA